MLGLAAGLVTGNVHFALASIPVLALAAGLALTRPAPFHAELTESGLSIVEPPEQVLFSAIESLRLAGAAQDPKSPVLKAGPLLVMHREGVLEIPSRLNVPVADLYRHLAAQVCGSGSREVHPQLASYLAQEEAAFGPERVWTFGARRHLGRRNSTRRARAVCLLLVLAGIVLVVAVGVLEKRTRLDLGGWVAAGVLLAIFSLFFWLVCKLVERHPDRSIRQWERSSLVVSPSGIALAQGDVQGRMRWDELRDVTFSARPGFISGGGSSRGLAGIWLIVPGAAVRIADVYDRPLPLICSVIRRYWRGSE